MPDLKPDFRAILTALSDGHVRFVLIGGAAMTVQGCAHVTDDVDVCYARDRENIVALANALAKHRVRLRGVPEDLPFIFDVQAIRSGQNFTLRTDIGDVDILGDAAGIDGFEGLWERSTETDLYGRRMRVASVEDLIAMKRAANRLKDQGHLLELEALQNLLKSQEEAAGKDKPTA